MQPSSSSRDFGLCVVFVTYLLLSYHQLMSWELVSHGWSVVSRGTCPVWSRCLFIVPGSQCDWLFQVVLSLVLSIYQLRLHLLLTADCMVCGLGRVCSYSTDIVHRERLVWAVIDWSDSDTALMHVSVVCSSVDWVVLLLLIDHCYQNVCVCNST